MRISIVFLLFLIIGFSQRGFSQVKGAFDGFNYQAVVIQKKTFSLPGVDEYNLVLGDMDVKVKFSILNGSNKGDVEYVETHETKSHGTGIFSVVVGKGTAIKGIFSNINWRVDGYIKFFKVEIDIGKGYYLL